MDDLNIKTIMIVWDLNLQIVNKGQVDILTPVFSLNSTEKENKNWIRLDRLDNNITISSNLSSLDEFKQCKTYMINSSTNKVEDVYEGFKTFKYKHNGWIEKARFVFELKMQYASPADPPIIWKHCTTEMKSPINTSGDSLILESETASHTVLNNQGVECLVERYKTEDTSYPHAFTIIPKRRSGNWNLFTIILRKDEDDALGWYYLHLISEAGWCGKAFSEFEPLVILKINELTTEIANMSEREIDAVKNVLKRHLSSTENKEEMKNQLNKASSYLKDYLADNKLSEITVPVGDYQLRVQQVRLPTSANSITELHDLNISESQNESSAAETSELKPKSIKINKSIDFKFGINIGVVNTEIKLTKSKETTNA